MHAYCEANFFVVFNITVVVSSASELMGIINADVVVHFRLGHDFPAVTAAEVADIVKRLMQRVPVLKLFNGARIGRKDFGRERSPRRSRRLGNSVSLDGELPDDGH